MPKSEDGAPSGEVVEVGGLPRGEDGLPIARADDDGAAANTGRLHRQRSEVQPGFRRIGGMVAQKEGIETELVGETSGVQDSLCWSRIFRAGERLESPPDATAKFTYPGVWTNRAVIRVHVNLHVPLLHFCRIEIITLGDRRGQVFLKGQIDFLVLLPVPGPWREFPVSNSVSWLNVA